jgi:ubiquitin-protein ligase
MATPQEIRLRRLKNDYQEMVNIRGEVIDWEITEGQAPYPEGYRLKLNVRTISNETPEYSGTHELQLTLPEAYPQAPPQIEFLSEPLPYHPNWYKSGRWCFGTWEMSEGLGHHVIRMVRTLQYDQEITNEHSPANYDANDWYVAHKNSGMFPSDAQILPDPTRTCEENQAPPKRSSFRIEGFGSESTPAEDQKPKPRFRID